MWHRLALKVYLISPCKRIHLKWPLEVKNLSQSEWHFQTQMSSFLKMKHKCDLYICTTLVSRGIIKRVHVYRYQCDEVCEVSISCSLKVRKRYVGNELINKLIFQSS